MRVRDVIWALTLAPLDSEVYMLIRSDEPGEMDETDIGDVMYDPETNNVFVMEVKDAATDRPTTPSQEA